MMDPMNNQPRRGITYTGLGMGVGLVFGALIGLLIGNMVVFAGGGLVLGLAIGLALERGKKGNNP